MGKRIIESPVPFALRKIFIEKSSGELTVKGESFEKKLYFVEGNLCFAKTNVLQERLGEILFKLGKINQTQFWDIHILISGQKGKIGEILVKKNFLSQKDLFFGLIFQVRMIALSTFSMNSGEWKFSTMHPEIPEDAQIKIELPGIFSEGVQQFKSLPLFKNNYLFRSLVLKPISAEISGFLTAEEMSFNKELRDHANLSAEQIFAKMKVSEETFWQRILFFFLLNILEFADTAIDKELNQNIEELIVLFEKLKINELDFYELFNLKNTATFNEIKDIYYQYAKKFHPDRFGNAPDIELKEKANFVFAQVNKAFDILSNDDKRREYDTKGYKEFQSKDKIAENLIEKASVFFRKAKTLYSQKKFWEAASFLEEAVRNDPEKSAYYLLLGLSQSNIPTLRRVAEKNFQKMIEMEPWNAEPFVALGLLFMSEKLNKRAEGFFRKALSINPDHELARTKIAELLGDDKKSSLFSMFHKKK